MPSTSASTVYNNNWLSRLKWPLLTHNLPSYTSAIHLEVMLIDQKHSDQSVDQKQHDQSVDQNHHDQSVEMNTIINWNLTSLCFPEKMPLARDLLHPQPHEEKRKHKVDFMAVFQKIWLYVYICKLYLFLFPWVWRSSFQFKPPTKVWYLDIFQTYQ